jgi:hypothetical protein
MISVNPGSSRNPATRAGGHAPRLCGGKGQSVDETAAFLGVTAQREDFLELVDHQHDS